MVKFCKEQRITTEFLFMYGFPEETEEEFSATLEFIRSCGFAQMHIFPYSIRPGTPAAKMTQIHKSVKEERAHRAAEVAAEMHRAYLEGCIGKSYPVLFEQPRGGLFSGHAPNYMEVRVKADDLHNQVRSVRITGVEGDVLLGELADIEV
jgi:threonylcarbamoyladenosine tRNA methylthiotransferase MtaB